MKMTELIREAIAPAHALLIGAGMPADRVDTPAARAQSVAIAMQESLIIHRRQLVGTPPRPVGPAKSFWQAERGGGMVHGVRTHPATRKYAQALYAARNVEAANEAIWDAIENDDILAAGLARLLLWSDPLPLPNLGDTEGTWALYLRTWRPGAYSRGSAGERANLRDKWRRNYAFAIDAVMP